MYILYPMMFKLDCAHKCKLKRNWNFQGNTTTKLYNFETITLCNHIWGYPLERITMKYAWFVIILSNKELSEYLRPTTVGGDGSKLAFIH